MADVITGNTQLAPTKQDIIASAVQRELKEASFMAGLVTDVSQFAGKGMKRISFPKLSSFSIQQRGSGVAGDASALTATIDSLDLDESAYCAWIVDVNDEIQSTIDFQMEAARRASSAHGRFVDDAIIAELIASADLSVNAGVPADITKENILAMRQRLIESNCIMSNLRIVITPDQEAVMLQIPEFVEADKYGSSNIASGVIGRVYGVPVYVHNSNELGTQQAVMFDRDALAIGFQRRAGFDEQKEISYGTGAMKQAVDQLFGVKSLQNDVATDKHTPAAGKSLLIAKLAD